jgi:hypothetical protein
MGSQAVVCAKRPKRRPCPEKLAKRSRKPRSKSTHIEVSTNRERERRGRLVRSYWENVDRVPRTRRGRETKIPTLADSADFINKAMGKNWAANTIRKVSPARNVVVRKARNTNNRARLREQVRLEQQSQGVGKGGEAARE